jgi:hypothetical protein
MREHMTYGELYETLLELGYRRRSVQVNGKQGEVFEHETIPNAMIVLPQNNPDAPVEPFYMGSVLGILKSRGVIRETNHQW